VLFAVLLAAFAGIGWRIYTYQAAPVRPARATADIPVPVAAATAETGDVNNILNALGTVTPLATDTVRSQISGYLTKVAFQEGQTVQQGQLLAQIDPRLYAAALQQSQGQLQRDQALLKNARLDLTRFRTLATQDSIAGQQVDTQQSLVQQDEGVVKADEALVEAAQVNLNYCSIVAPITGRIGLRQVDVGNYVQANDSSGIATITQMQPIAVVFPVPEDNLPEIVKQLRAGATLPVVAYNRDQSVKLAEGKLLTTDNQVDTTTGTVKLKAEFDNQDESLFPDQFVNAQLVVNVIHDATVIPTAAVQRGEPGTFVYLIRPDQTVTVRPVKLGIVDGERVIVAAGLAPGDRVVVDGADKLRDGAKVSVRTAQGDDSRKVSTADSTDPVKVSDGQSASADGRAPL
jgi:multidrug efflux system membrane fusion protein